MEENENFIHKIPNPSGRPPKFSKAAQLWDKFVEYCDYIDANPWQIKTASNSLNAKGETKNNSLRQEVKPLQRAYTLYGFCAFAGIRYKWADFKKNYWDKGDDFRGVIDQIENIVMAQQLDGALLNQFNGNLVARINGIADKQVSEITGKDGEPFQFPKLQLSDIEELKKINGLCD